MHSAFQADRYLLKRQVLALTGKIRIYDLNGRLMLYSQQKMFSLKEDIRVYVDENRSQELLLIKARQIIDFSAAYDITDSFSGEAIGVIRRKGLRSMLRDEWQILTPQDQLIGVLIEDDLTQALLRRFLLGNLLPQNYDILINNQRVMDLRQRFNLLRYEMDLDFTHDSLRQLDPRLGIAAAILLAIIEGRQD